MQVTSKDFLNGLDSNKDYWTDKLKDAQDKINRQEPCQYHKKPLTYLSSAEAYCNTCLDLMALEMECQNV